MADARYRLAMLDVDGTLQHQGSWHPGAMELLGVLRELGITIALCSGRAPVAMMSLAREVGGVDYLASNSGSTVLRRDGDGWATLAHRTIPREVFAELIGGARSHGLEAWAFTDRQWLIAERSARVEVEESFVGDRPTLGLHADRADVGKVLLHALDDTQQAAARAFGDLPGLVAVSSAATFVDLVPAVSAAAKGGDILVPALGLGWDEVIAIGDGENDRGMLSHAGLGIAVAPMTAELLDAPRPGQVRSSVADTAGAYAALADHLGASH